jgi:hypothetical protein
VKRITVLLVLAASAIVVAPATAQAPRSALRSFVCQKALDPAGRAISITAVMRPVSGTTKLAMRFELLKRISRGTRPASLAGRDLKVWLMPSDPPTLGQQPGDTWVVHHPVVDLAAPALYRFRVSFRWLGPGGKVLGTMTRVSRPCLEPELRPDLAVSALQVHSLQGGFARYTALVRNSGNTASGPFSVQLAVGGGVVGTQAVTQLAPHSHLQVHFRAPACTAGEPITVIADPTDQVDDYNRDNNTLQTMCPSPAGSSGASGAPVPG